MFGFGSSFWKFFLLAALFLGQALAPTLVAALPTRLVLLVDGISYRDVKALQEGVTSKDSKGREVFRQAFHKGYFPVSRLVSTFPSISDPAWTEILGNEPTPGYQRTYFNASDRSKVTLNGVTSLVEYERQMTGPIDSGFRRVMGYVFPLGSFKKELDALVENFLKSGDGVTNYYALIHSTDVAQHLSGDIQSMLYVLDEKLQALRAVYREREGKELEILVLSDHGNNHAGFGKRVAIKSFLRKAGYRVVGSIRSPKDVVLPTAGIESWVEIHNAPGETERLAQALSHMEGVDLLTAHISGRTNRFIVLNAKGERARIEWNEEKDSYRYAMETGDPLEYRPVIEALTEKRKIDAEGFATAEAWMAETLTHRYPLALERIIRGHTEIARNPASILISLKNDYVHCEWLIRRGVVLVKSGGTHGGLDALNSNGVLLSSFAPTSDTSTRRVAAQFGGFEGLRDHRDGASAAKWIVGEAADGKGRGAHQLQIRTPLFRGVSLETPIELTFEPLTSLRPELPRFERKYQSNGKRVLTLNSPELVGNQGDLERTYALPVTSDFKPQSFYSLVGRFRGLTDADRLFRFTFRTDPRGFPMAGSWGVFSQ